MNLRDIKHILQFCTNYNGINLARKAAEKYAEKAKSKLSDLEDNQYKDEAIKFVDFVINRKR